MACAPWSKVYPGEANRPGKNCDACERPRGPGGTTGLSDSRIASNSRFNLRKASRCSAVLEHSTSRDSTSCFIRTTGDRALGLIRVVVVRMLHSNESVQLSGVAVTVVGSSHSDFISVLDVSDQEQDSFILQPILR